MDALPHLYTILLCQSNQESLWPLSRRLSPYDLLIPTLGGQNSILGNLLHNLAPLNSHPITILADHELTGAIREHILGQAILEEEEFEIIGENFSRSSALTIALASARIKLQDPQAILLVAGPGLRIDTDEFWTNNIARACAAAEEGYITLLGSEPTDRPSRHTCVATGPEIPGLSGVFHAHSYMEAPSTTYAGRMSTQKVLWCMDLMVMQATTALARLQGQGDQIARIAQTANFLSAVDSDRWMSEEARELVESLPRISFTQAVLEQDEDVLAVIPTTSEWSSFSALEELTELETDGNGCAGEGRQVMAECNDTVVLAKGNRLVTTLGTRNLMVVDTPDALLVADRGHLEDLSPLLEQLEAEGAPELEQANVTAHVWGTSEVLWHGGDCRVERVTVVPGGELPLETIGNTKERWTVVEGALDLLYENRERRLSKGDTAIIKPYYDRYLYNPTLEPAMAIVVSTYKEEPAL